MRNAGSTGTTIARQASLRRSPRGAGFGVPRQPRGKVVALVRRHVVAYMPSWRRLKLDARGSARARVITLAPASGQKGSAPWAEVTQDDGRASPDAEGGALAHSGHTSRSLSYAMPCAAQRTIRTSAPLAGWAGSGPVTGGCDGMDRAPSLSIAAGSRFSMAEAFALRRTATCSSSKRGARHMPTADSYLRAGGKGREGCDAIVSSARRSGRFGAC